MSLYADVIVLASAARTASVGLVQVPVPPGATKVSLFINATALAATPSVVFDLQAEVAPGVFGNLVSSAAITAVGLTVLTAGRGVVAAANASSSAVIGRTIGVVATAGDADSLTYSVIAKFA